MFELFKPPLPRELAAAIRSLPFQEPVVCGGVRYYNLGEVLDAAEFRGTYGGMPKGKAHLAFQRTADFADFSVIFPDCYLPAKKASTNPRSKATEIRG